MNDFEAIVICNHPVEQFMFTEFLRISNVPNVIAANTQSALNKLSSNVKLMVTCLHENDSETLTIIKAIRNKSPDLTIIVLSPSSMDQVMHQVNAAGASSYAVMPIKLVDFVELIQKFFPQLK